VGGLCGEVLGKVSRSRRQGHQLKSRTQKSYGGANDPIMGQGGGRRGDRPVVKVTTLQKKTNVVGPEIGEANMGRKQSRRGGKKPGKQHKGGKREQPCQRSPLSLQDGKTKMSPPRAAGTEKV